MQHRAPGTPVLAAHRAVDRIAQQRRAQPLERVDPQLVRAPGLGPEPDERAPLSAFADRFEQLPVRHRRLALLRRDHAPAFRLGTDLRQRQRDRARLFRRLAIDHREIGLGHLPRLERGVEALQRLGIARQQQAAAGVGIEPVDRHRAALEPQLQLVEPVEQARPASPGAIDREAGGLVDHQRFAVFEQDRDGQDGGHVNRASNRPRTALPSMKPPFRSSSVRSASRARPFSIR